jgi:hypothetical protein
MKSIEALLDEADELLEAGEAKIVLNAATGYQMLRQAISNLSKAYLIANGREPLGDLKALFFQCRKLNPEFEMIEDGMIVFADPDHSELDSETIVDTANEIWDFIMGILPTVADEL